MGLSVREGARARQDAKQACSALQATHGALAPEASALCKGCARRRTGPAVLLDVLDPEAELAGAQHRRQHQRAREQARKEQRVPQTLELQAHTQSQSEREREGTKKAKMDLRDARAEVHLRDARAEVREGEKKTGVDK
eukprot:1238717-Pleurochrysis_carterae.AAC.4